MRVASSYPAFPGFSRQSPRIHATWEAWEAWEGSMVERPEIQEVAGLEVIRRADGMFGVYDSDGIQKWPFATAAEAVKAAEL